VDSQADLFEIVLALRASCGLTDLLDGGQEKADQDRNDGNHNQQFDQRKTPALAQGSDHTHTPLKLAPWGHE
jgi:hypothetical protein